MVLTPKSSEEMSDTWERLMVRGRVVRMEASLLQLVPGKEEWNCVEWEGGKEREGGWREREGGGRGKEEGERRRKRRGGKEKESENKGK